MDVRWFKLHVIEIELSVRRTVTYASSDSMS